MRNQSELIEKEDYDWLIICDGGRRDIFEKNCHRFLSGEYQPVYNGGFGFTANWFNHHFSRMNEFTLFHGGVPIHSFKNNPHDYDEREYFDNVIGWERYEWDDRITTAPPQSIINVVKNSEADKGVIRFLQPHNPYRLLSDVNNASDAREYTHDELLEAYKDNYLWVMKYIRDELLNIIDGEIIVTADHGQCLGDCGQYLHSQSHDKHEHLVNVPWIRLD